MLMLIEKAKTMVHQVVIYVKKTYDYLRNLVGEFFGVYPVNPELEYSPEEHRLIIEGAELLRKFFPESPGEILLQEDFESRCQVLEDFGSQLIQRFGLQNSLVIVTNDPQVFPEDPETVTFGANFLDTGIVCINANLLLVENADVLGHMVSTVIHELRHVMQTEAMNLVNTRGIPYARRRAWRHTTANYVDGRLDMEAYSKQSVEVDARDFTGRVWLWAYAQKIPLGGN